MLKDHLKNHIILALDLEEPIKAIELLTAVAPYIDVVKVGIPLILFEGCPIFRKIKEHVDLPILADIKLADVPHIARKVSKMCFSFGADAITVHGFVGPSTIEACVEEAGGNKDVIVITESTHSDASLFMESAAKTIAEIARDTGATGIQSPGNRPEHVSSMRQIVGEDLLIVSCGMGFQGGEEGKALRAGADFEIYGRSIYDKNNPVEEAKRLSSVLRSTSDLGHNF
jgi:orotidine-5'-phosphate decarboxylase